MRRPTRTTRTVLLFPYTTLFRSPAAPIDPPAPHAELEELFAHLVRDLDDAGYFVPADRTTSTLRTLRTTLTKTGWSHNDIRMMHGIIATLGRARKPAREIGRAHV